MFMLYVCDGGLERAVLVGGDGDFVDSIVWRLHGQRREGAPAARTRCTAVINGVTAGMPCQMIGDLIFVYTYDLHGSC